MVTFEIFQMLESLREVGGKRGVVVVEEVEGSPEVVVEELARGQLVDAFSIQFQSFI